MTVFFWRAKCIIKVIVLIIRAYNSKGVGLESNKRITVLHFYVPDTVPWIVFHIGHNV